MALTSSISSMQVSIALFILLITWLARKRFQYGLTRFKGPFLSSISPFGTIYQMWRDRRLPPYLHLHEKYGDVVRLSPTKLSFPKPEAIKDIYGPKGIETKSDFHLAHQQIDKGVAYPTLFASVDPEWHHRVRRCVSSAYSMTSMIQYEQWVDETIGVLIEQLSTRFADKTGADGVLDLPKWIHFFTDDAITCVTYGARIGHMEAGEDIAGMLAFGEQDSKYAILVGQVQSVEYLGQRNPLWLWLQRRGLFVPRTPLSVEFASKQQQQRRDRRQANDEQSNVGVATLTDKFLAAEAKYPDIVGGREVLALGLSLVAAGSDTTAISIQLVAEIDDAYEHSKGRKLSFAEAQRLPYLSAYINETFRMHPATHYFPERVVPAQGHTVCGEFLSPGTVVGVSAWVLHRNTDIFGSDANVFRAERWNDEPMESVRLMQRTLTHFGSQSGFMCLGKNVALLEMFKVIPALLRQFRIEFVDPSKEWVFKLGTFVSVDNIDVRLQRRDLTSL
ncbi:hypothetical protein PWT90_08814 [Aphanocladium album]|nr:hypothetical protein PWT90_08814 [Aphanocladium album]